MDYLQQTVLEAWCEFCESNLTNELTGDGDKFVCDSCSMDLCEWCESRVSEHEVNCQYVCQRCVESRGDALYDSWKDYYDHE